MEPRSEPVNIVWPFPFTPQDWEQTPPAVQAYLRTVRHALGSTIIAHLAGWQIAPTELIGEHPELGHVQIRQTDVLEAVGQAMALTDVIAVMAVEQRLLLLQDHQRVVTAVCHNIGFE